MLSLGARQPFFQASFMGLVEGRGFDLAAASFGVVDDDRVILGDRISDGDAVVGLASSGIHSNGLTLARKILVGEEGKRVHERLPSLGRSVGEELLSPTMIYVRVVLELLSKFELHGLAHITGGSFSKLKRFGEYSKTGFQLDSMPDPLPVFKEVQARGGVSDREMYRTFNMGVGFCVMAERREAEDVVDTCERLGYSASVIGRVVKKPAVRIRLPRGRWIDI